MLSLILFFLPNSERNSLAIHYEGCNFLGLHDLGSTTTTGRHCCSSVEHADSEHILPRQRRRPRLPVTGGDGIHHTGPMDDGRGRNVQERGHSFTTPAHHLIAVPEAERVAKFVDQYVNLPVPRSHPEPQWKNSELAGAFLSLLVLTWEEGSGEDVTRMAPHLHYKVRRMVVCGNGEVNIRHPTPNLSGAFHQIGESWLEVCRDTAAVDRIENDSPNRSPPHTHVWAGACHLHNLSPGSIAIRFRRSPVERANNHFVLLRQRGWPWLSVSRGNPHVHDAVRIGDVRPWHPEAPGRIGLFALAAVGKAEDVAELLSEDVNLTIPRVLDSDSKKLCKEDKLAGGSTSLLVIFRKECSSKCSFPWIHLHHKVGWIVFCGHGETNIRDATPDLACALEQIGELWLKVGQDTGIDSIEDDGWSRCPPHGHPAIQSVGTHRTNAVGPGENTGCRGGRWGDNRERCPIVRVESWWFEIVNTVNSRYPDCVLEWRHGKLS
eukprot:m.408021 g.408021  ORF g.408021 m.408021 type:complete len:492 (-) comp16800_c0_seq9:6889-8364(-)